MGLACSVVMPEPARRTTEELRGAAQAFLDRWYPGTEVTVDRTGEGYLVQLARGPRLGESIWVGGACTTSLEEDLPLSRKLLAAAWRLARCKSLD